MGKVRKIVSFTAFVVACAIAHTMKTKYTADATKNKSLAYEETSAKKKFPDSRSQPPMSKKNKGGKAPSKQNYHRAKSKAPVQKCAGASLANTGSIQELTVTKANVDIVKPGKTEKANRKAKSSDTSATTGKRKQKVTTAIVAVVAVVVCNVLGYVNYKGQTPEYLTMKKLSAKAESQVVQYIGAVANEVGIQPDIYRVWESGSEEDRDLSVLAAIPYGDDNKIYQYETTKHSLDLTTKEVIEVTEKVKLTGKEYIRQSISDYLITYLASNGMAANECVYQVLESKAGLVVLMGNSSDSLASQFSYFMEKSPESSMDTLFDQVKDYYNNNLIRRVFG